MEKELRPWETLKMILITLGVLLLIGIIIGIFIVNEPIKYVSGILLGGAVSVMRIVLLSRAVGKAVNMEVAQSKVYMMGQYNLRMMLTIAVVVVGCIMSEYFNIYSIIIGVVLLQPAVYISNFIYEKKGGEKIESVSTSKTNRNS